MLDNEISRLLNSAHRESTSRVYQSPQKSYLTFCKEFAFELLPLNEEVLLKYVSYLSLRQLSSATINVYCSAIRSYSIMNGHGSPLDQFLKLKMALRSLEIKGKPPNRKLPITLEILEKIQLQISDTYDHTMLWGVITLAHFGLLRAAEFTVKSQYNHQVNLSLSDLSFHVSDEGISYIKLFIKQSKTDKGKTGFYLHVGCSGIKVCAYCALRRYHTLTILHGTCIKTIPYANGSTRYISDKTVVHV